ncbi:nuclear transport factor 2 family protein [Paracidovorax anthurii]|uniref:Putative SnoaL-like aldol condensation-catalyzing enzyme n=1 Tax=Paracidovorax anthurii TaxID=78229 RepID=A0A328Z0C3_9BURK|nr:nuclear transport factor 2 family protein [Paracidovorax anthurii]RAR76267.1 putative SnoaL-like aldol condensation-catalyzing enzyme [Paracidovorax anthurii]
MNKLTRSLAAAALVLAAMGAGAQVPVLPNPDQDAMLASPDPQLAANKRIVYDFWREVFEGLHMELAPKYLTNEYIQHNPNVPSGRAAFVDFFSKRGQPKAIQPRITGPLVTIVAERDLVTLVFSREYPEPSDPSKKYTTTWFDMFRIEGGKIAEHWDPAVKR